MPTHPARAALAALIVAIAQPVAADEAAAPVPAVQRTPDPCTFYRMRARNLGINHWATEVVWACEAIAQRREAGMDLNDRMLAVEFALESYREALVADRRERIARPGSRARAEQREAEERLAEETGMLAALEAIRTGF
jgi:hypothetical protein